MRLYLDHNASTAIRPEVVAAMADAMSRTANPSSVHRDGQIAARAVEDVRRLVGRLLCARAEDVIFTSGGTEATNLALHSAIDAGNARRLIVSALEHEAIAATARASGLPVETLPVTRAGIADLAWLEQRLAGWDADRDGHPVLALMLANNEIGTIQPVAEAAALIHAHDGLMIVDAIQAVGKIPVDFAALGADYMAISAHKFGGPQGSGALIAACNAPLSRHHHGGGQEKGRRGGTLNVAGITGLGRALELAVADLDEFAGLATWRDALAARLKAAAPEIEIMGEGAPRLPNTLAIAHPSWKGETQVMAMDLANISISAGSACSSGKARGSKAGLALGLEAGLAEGLVRISFGWTSNESDIDAFARAWTAAHARIAPKLDVNA
ncbi:cysteine desulfurase family protein [Maricaulis sp.]|uniref:cysteine desulfurase family protein n=1 Tax=Maricaulis sp. TaxID=1486257 RepID=UPI003A8EF9BA